MVIQLSGLPITEFCAKKELYNNRPFLHLYVEVSPSSAYERAITVEVLRQHLSVYFHYVDQDYKDLKKILGIEPLQITLLKIGTFAMYKKAYGQSMERINPSIHAIQKLLSLQQSYYEMEGKI